MDKSKDPYDTLSTPAVSETRSPSLIDDPAQIGRYRVIRLLGRGGFGHVYLAHDDDLNRSVAIKVPNPERISRPKDIEAYLNEARIVASLDHPHIVPVYDVGRTEDGLCFVVSKFIEGSDLATRMKEARLSFQGSVALVADIAEALHLAHTRGLVHRDIKPANILIDRSGKPFVADFGLALTDEDFGKGSGLAGTPAYMSPEQARGEGHRVDGRSDIFSLGVVFYELLTGRRPFIAKAHDKDEILNELLDLIATTEVRPPRQIDHTIPKELERICLKAMSKRTLDRYTAAWDMAEDLRTFLNTAGDALSPAGPVVPKSPPPGSTLEIAPLPPTSRQSDSDQRPTKIIPKGLRSFDEHDADFFLELLPGPRDRDGLPDSIRFWKRKIEQIDPDLTFKVGLIYGPSGCGKSSLFKAGLLPRLGRHVLPVYVEATAEETEARMLRGLRKVCPELSRGPGLVDSLAQIRRGRILAPEWKVLLVLDQFEQWLHARRGDENTELIAALRHCDGEHVQAIVIVRDDFWLAASRFMRDLEIRLVEGDNSALVDLFDPRHAKKVLTAFGRAYGAFPERIGDLSSDQESFLDQSISGLVQDGKVISVRLALFAEMVKGKPWNPVTLNEVGGTEGIGLTFLEETFSASTAPPEHRLHQKAAQAVLKTLLPESGTDIKGQMRSRKELLEASGYANRPTDFDDLLRILDPELRLITPTDPEGSSNDGQTTAHPQGRYYQLTHDYLVPSLREWLTRKQRETRKGRAELRLAERSSLWNDKPENRHLTSGWEWANIRVLTASKDWTSPQKKMMKRAAEVHGVRSLLSLLLVVCVVLGVLAVRRRVEEDRNATHAEGLVEQVLKANTSQVPGIVDSMRNYRRWVDPALKTSLAKSSEGSPEKFHASLALLPVDPGQADYLYQRLLKATPGDLAVIAQALRRDHQAALTPKLWSVIDSAAPDDSRLLPVASALAFFDPGGRGWANGGDKVARALVRVNQILLGGWIEALRPVRTELTRPLTAIFRDRQRPETERSIATTILADYASDDGGLLASLLMDAEPPEFTALYPAAERQRQGTIPPLQVEFKKSLKPDWSDPPVDSSWSAPDPSLVRRVEVATGSLAERYGFCQTMPLDEFRTVVESLRKSGYRPTRFRPYADGLVVRVAAVWARDGRDWILDSGLSDSEVRRTDDQRQADGYLPVDVAGYKGGGIDAKSADHYAALWVKRGSPEEKARAYVGELKSIPDKFKPEGLLPTTLQALLGPDGKTRYSGVWVASPFDLNVMWNQTEASLGTRIASRTDTILSDLSLTGAEVPVSSRERIRVALASAERAITEKPDDFDTRFARAIAFCGLDEWQKALDDLNTLVGNDPTASILYRHRSLAHAHLRLKDDALADLAKYQAGDGADSDKLAITVGVRAELGDGEVAAIAALEEAMKKRPGEFGLLYDAACAYSLASVPVSARDKTRGREYAEKATSLLAQAIRQGYSDYDHLIDDADLDPIRDQPGYTEALRPGHLDRRYAAAWISAPDREAIAVNGLDPSVQRQRCRELEAEGYRPVSFSVARTKSTGPPITASVWQRPVVTEVMKDQLAVRQARAAVALVRMGKSDEVWPLLRHSADPRLRSFIVNWLNPLGAEPQLIAAELVRLDRAGRGSHDPAQEPDRRSPGTGKTADTRRPSVTGRAGSGDTRPALASAMDAVLFHPETSVRRALILALGAYGTAGLSPAEREPLIAKLLDLYRGDPDAGIHGAAEWALRQWNSDEKLREIDAELTKLKDRGERRWFVNSLGQTFAVIDGPVEFMMGSPPSDPERNWNERSHRVVIPRRFAIATKEVSKEQWDAFVKQHPELASDAAVVNKISPDPKGPMVGFSWFTAAAFCNWLSEQEGLPKCYVPASNEEFTAGMTIPADVLMRKGYRLPTEAEWEYACRSGTMSSRYYGFSVDLLLSSYARYQANSKEHAWMCGSLRPNDLGLFDMLGNMYEWVQDETLAYKEGGVLASLDDINIISHVNEYPRLLRGGSFDNPPATVRSALRNWFAPSDRNSNLGFRPSRTYP